MANKTLEQKTTENSYSFNYLGILKSLFDGSQNQPTKNYQTQSSKNNQIYHNTSFYRTFV